MIQQPQYFAKCDKRVMQNCHLKHVIPDPKQGIHVPMPSTKYEDIDVSPKENILQSKITTLLF